MSDEIAHSACSLDFSKCVCKHIQCLLCGVCVYYSVCYVVFVYITVFAIWCLCILQCSVQQIFISQWFWPQAVVSRVKL